MKGIALPVEYLVILIIAIVVLLAVVVWYLYFFPHCPDPSYEFNKACTIWFGNNKCGTGWSSQEIPKTYVDARVGSSSCNPYADDTDPITMEELCKYKGIFEEESCKKACGCV
jgi:hypothetical protein